MLLALRILVERPVHEPSHDEVLREILGIDIKTARKTGRQRRKQDVAKKADRDQEPDDADVDDQEDAS